MDTADIPSWIKVLGVFAAAVVVFLLAAWDIILDWITDSVKGLFGSRAKH